ncbi:unnamed protein product [Auanema sp. JU1783]|nr:unnamed protein product [Auanema sp. JU1783]
MSLIPPMFDFDTEFAKLSKTCLSKEDYEQLWNNTVHHALARIYNRYLIKAALEIIGRTEMRTTLNFSPHFSWKFWGHRVFEEPGKIWPSESELASATTIEAYYNLVEPPYVISNPFMFRLEKVMTPAVAFLDTRFPFIRAYFRRSFEEIRQRDGGEINRKLVDNMIHKFEEVLYKFSNELAKSPSFDYSDEKSENCDG